MPDAPASSEPDLDYAHFRVRRNQAGANWVLGVGSMGITYRARDQRLQVDVALKVVHPARLGDPDIQRLFIREARAAARVNHPNVASVVFLEDADPARVFYAMEFVDGVSLLAWLRKQGRARITQALGFAAQIAAGLGAIHEAGIIHRDLKPANVMVVQYPPSHPRHRPLNLSGGCLLKIIDFGLARAVERAVETDPDAPLPTTGFRGTAIYASPEQCNETANLDARSDLYALGCMLWEMLAGRPPFFARSHRELLNLQVSAEPPWADLRGVPDAVATVLRGLLAKDRAQRYPNAGAAAEALAAAMQVIGGSAAEAHPPEPGTMPVPAPTSVAATPEPAHVTLNVPTRWWMGTLIALVMLITGVAYPLLFRRSAPAADPALAPARVTASSIAVLPFVNKSGDKASEFFAEGIHDDVLSSLGKISSLRVVSLASASRLRGGKAEPRDLARELGVASVLEGSVRQQGTRVRVTTQLNDAATGQQLWAETFERELTDAFEIQSAVAREISRALAATVSPDEQRAIAKQPTRNHEALEIFLRTRAQQRRTTRTESEQFALVQHFERAIELDPAFALAWAHLSYAHSTIYWFAVDQSPARAALARQAAEKALELEPSLPEAHVAMGRVIGTTERNYPGALREFNVALGIEPGNAEALDAASHTLRRLNRWDEGLRLQRQAVALTPDDPQKLNALGTHLLNMRRMAEAEEFFRQATALSNNAYREMDLLGAILERTGDWEAYAKRTRELLPKMPPDRRYRVQLWMREFAGALKTLEELPGEDLAYLSRRVPKSLIRAAAHQGLGEPDNARREYTDAAEKLRPLVAAAPEDPRLRMRWAQALAGSGAKAESLRESATALAQLTEKMDAVSHRQLLEEQAEILALLGEKDRACEVLEQLNAVESRVTPVMLRFFPTWDPLRGHPRFEKLVGRR